MELQQTIAGELTFDGPGLFADEHATVTCRPAPANHGIVFVRTDLDDIHIPALVANVDRSPRRTCLKVGDARIETCEHLMSAIAALSIDNLLIEIDHSELPALDTSAKSFYEKLSEVGIEPQEDAPRKVFRIEQPVVVKHDGAMIAAVPSEAPGMEVVYDLDYTEVKPIGRQIFTFDSRNGRYADEIAPARTFILEEEAKAAQAAGIGKHLTPDDVLVIGPEGPLGSNQLRFPDEYVRHKIVDLIGDLYLLGAPVQGRIIAYKSGHSLNHALVRALLEKLNATQRASRVKEASIDVRGLMRMLPHRYPMLLVDRVIEIDGDERAVGIKNVSMNEPFFQGHYPGTPIMPGVLIVEAMAQLSGVLIGQKLEHTGKLAVLLSLDKVKLRRPVTPGDQLILEAEAVRVRNRIAHMRCRAYVGEEMAAESEVKFMLVDDEET